MSSDSDYERATVANESSKGRVSKAWDALQSSFTQSVETVTRNRIS